MNKCIMAQAAIGILEANLSYTEVADLTLDPSSTITSTSQAIITVRADFLVTLADSFSGPVVSACSPQHQS